MLTRPLIKTPKWLEKLTRCQRGVSAVEFSLIAPFLVIGGISTVDAGMAIYDKMMLTQVLRAGAHSAIGAESEASMLAMLEATAGDNFTLAQGQPNAGELAVDVNSYCVCPDDTSTQISCNTVCTGGITPNEFYSLTANIDFDGIILPNFSLSSSIDVIAQ